MMWDSAGVEAGRVMDRDTLFSSTAFGLVPDTTGGAIVTWPKYRPGDSSQIWAQHLTAAGAAAWDTGECISECPGYYDLPAFLTTDDGKNGAIGCWGFHASIYASAMVMDRRVWPNRTRARHLQLRGCSRTQC